MTPNLVPGEFVDRAILTIREHRVMLDTDLARLYGGSTKALNQAVKRNAQRFPEDFMFVLSRAEKGELVTNCDHLANLKFSPALPKAFTEHGILMLSSVLNSERAVMVNIEIMRAVVRLRRMAASYDALAKRIDSLERKYDGQFKAVFDAVRQLMAPPERERKRIGFRKE